MNPTGTNQDLFSATSYELAVSQKVSLDEMSKKAPMVGLNLRLDTDQATEVLGEMIVALYTWVLSCEGKKEETETRFIRVPATWIDHFKERFFAEWAAFGYGPLSRLAKWVLHTWPIKWQSHSVKIEVREYRLCPHCTEKWEENKRTHLEWLCPKKSFTRLTLEDISPSFVGD